MDGQCSQSYDRPCHTRDNRVLYTILPPVVRLLLVTFPFPSSLPYVPSTARNIINRYHGPMEYCSNILRPEVQQRLSLPEEERPVRSPYYLTLYPEGSPMMLRLRRT